MTLCGKDLKDTALIFKAVSFFQKIKGLAAV